MCGIVGMIAKQKVQDMLVGALEKLEYRGYDSAGIATKKSARFKVTKQVGKVENLKKALFQETHKGNIGIAHTRWATHGEVNVVNAHPFSTKNWCLVHNGIINNYEELKKQHNIETQSKTDSEVIVCLLEKQQKQGIEAVIDVCKQLKGLYALAILNKNTNELYFAKKHSSLFVSQNKEVTIGASDVVCFADIASQFYRLEDNEFCTVSIDKLTFYDKNANVINKTLQSLEQINYQTDKAGYTHYMEKEIYETPNVVKNIYETYSKKNIINLPKNFLSKIDRVKFVGCGTAYHSTLFGSKYFEKITKIESTAHLASEFESELLTKNTLCVFVSQSGETADTINALKWAKTKKCSTICLTNVMHSTLATLADYSFPILAGVEIAVASTKTYCAQIIVMEILANYFASEKKQKLYFEKLKKFASSLQIPKVSTVNTIIGHIGTSKECFVLGRGKDFYTACESALKIKEITYVNCSAFPSGELKHGTLALVDENVPLILFCTNKKELYKSISAKKEIEARGGKVLFLSPFKVFGALLQQTYDDFFSISAILPIQLCAYRLSLLKSINPDKPRNLAKSVTVE